MISLDDARLRAERAEYAFSRVIAQLEEYRDSIHNTTMYVSVAPMVEQMKKTYSNLHIEHLQETTPDGILVCATCPVNRFGANVAWEHLHPRG